MVIGTHFDDLVAPQKRNPFWIVEKDCEMQVSKKHILEVQNI